MLEICCNFNSKQNTKNINELKEIANDKSVSLIVDWIFGFVRD